MNCNNVHPRISAYLDGELNGNEMLAVRTHLNDCRACAAEAQQMKALKSFMASRPTFEPPADLEERLVRNVIKKPAKQHTPIFTRSLAYVSGFAFAAALFSGLLLLKHNRNQPVANNNSNGSVRFEVARDQAFAAGGDPLSGTGAVLSANYGSK